MKNEAKFWRNFPLIFVLQFPGKLATRNFTKIPPHIRTSNSTRLNQNSFTAMLWELVGPMKFKSQENTARHSTKRPYPIVLRDPSPPPTFIWHRLVIVWPLFGQWRGNNSMLIRLPLPQCFCPCGRKLRPWSEKNSDQNSDHPRLCIYWGKEKPRPWSEFLGRETQTMVRVSGVFGVGVEEGALNNYQIIPSQQEKIHAHSF